MDFTASIIANIIAGFSLLLSISLGFFYVRDRRYVKYTIESEYMNNLLKWHWDVIHIIARLRIMKKEVDIDQCKEELATLSALIDQGRFFFPNIDRSDNYGSEKPPAFRGYRNLALDFLVALYNLFNQPLTTKSISQAEILQRHFTSIVFDIVRPESRLETIRKLTDKYFVQQKSFVDFLEHHDNSVIDYIWQ